MNGASGGPCAKSQMNQIGSRHTKGNALAQSNFLYSYLIFKCDLNDYCKSTDFGGSGNLDSIKLSEEEEE